MAKSLPRFGFFSLDRQTRKSQGALFSSAFSQLRQICANFGSVFLGYGGFWWVMAKTLTDWGILGKPVESNSGGRICEVLRLKAEANLRPPPFGDEHQPFGE